MTLTQELEAGGRFLIPFEGPGFFTGSQGERLGNVRCEIELSVPPGPGPAHLLRFGIISAGVELSESTSTGHFGATSVAGGGTLEPRGGGSTWFLRVGFQGLQSYDALTRALGRTFVPPDRFPAPADPLNGIVEGILSQDDQESLLFSGVVVLVSRALAPPIAVWGLRTTLEAAPFWRAERQVPYDDFRRTLRIRPVSLLDKTGDSSPTGGNMADQFRSASRIWGKCCIWLDVQPVEAVVVGNLKYSDCPEDVADCFDDVDPSTIEVFFVDNPLDPPYNGGATVSCGTNTAKVVLTDDNTHNSNLLAHELGHVFAGLHPYDPASGIFWEGDPGTVLEPSPTGKPNFSRNTLYNCQQSKNPALKSGRHCRMNPDARLRGPSWFTP